LDVKSHNAYLDG